MIREIKKRQIILQNRKPYSPEVRKFIQEMNMLEWVHSFMRLDGSNLGRSQIEKLIKGEYFEDVSLTEHVAAARYSDLLVYARELLGMSSSLNMDIIFNFYKRLSESPKPCYRKENPVLISLDYNPPHPSEIEEQLTIMMGWFYSEDPNMNVIEKAVLLHHRIIEIYPFETCSEAVARAAMHYYLMENGFPPFAIDLSEQEYNAAIIAYLKREKTEPFYKVIEYNLFQKMEVLMQITAQ